MNEVPLSVLWQLHCSGFLNQKCLDSDSNFAIRIEGMGGKAGEEMSCSTLLRMTSFDSFILLSGAGFDGVEEIKRHPFFVTIDWNVSGEAFLYYFS